MPTIAAIATPPGNGGIAVVRISGPGAKNLLARVFLPHSGRFVNFKPWTLHHGVALDAKDIPLDDALAVFMPGPRTYTGEDCAEIHCHGGNFIANAILESLLRLGARLAGPGEFTKRAYLNGRMDLSQAEAVAEMISAPSREAARCGLAKLEGALGAKARDLQARLDQLRAWARIGVDFPEDELPGLDAERFILEVDGILDAIGRLLAGGRRAGLMRKGALVALAGQANTGKSSLFNALAGRERALVSDAPGTTRDYIEEALDFSGLPVRLVDTAGLREGADDAVEAMGMERSKRLFDEADLIALVADCSRPASADAVDELPDKPRLVIWNKCDLQAPPAGCECGVSARTGENLEALAALIRQRLLQGAGSEHVAAPNLRQAAALSRAREALIELRQLAVGGSSCDLWLAQLDFAAAELESILELAPEDELLESIFSQFCVGK